MPLNIEVQTEHPDVTALKKRVVEVTHRYTNAHGWCNEANNALREAGVLDSPKNNIRVAITFTVAGSEEQQAVKVFNAADLIELSDDERKAFVAEQIMPDVSVAGVKVNLPVTIIDLNNTEATGMNSGLAYPEEFQHFYSSQEGRVAHLIRADRLHRRVREAIANGEPPEVVEAAMKRGYIAATCGMNAAYSATLTSTRSENRICVKCIERAGIY